MSLATSALAFDFADFAFKNLLTCFHPTVSAAKAEVKVHYTGVVKKNEMTLDISLRQAGGGKQVKAEVLADSTVLKGSKRCDYSVGWQDVK